MKPRKLTWIVTSDRGDMVGNSTYGTKKTAEMIVACYDRSPRRFSGPYRVLRAMVSWGNNRKAKVIR